MSAVPFQSHVAHARNIRRAFTERRGYDHKKGLEHMPCMHHSKSSEARLDQLVNEEYLQNKHHYMSSQQSKSENNVGQSKSSSSENIITAFSRPEAWKLTFGRTEGIKALSVSSNGLCQNIVGALQSFGDIN